MNNRNEKKGDILIVDDISENLQLLFTTQIPHFKM